MKIIDLHTFFNGLIKAAMFAAFYVAGVLSSSQVSQFTISTQKDRIESLESETARQRQEIDALSKRAVQNTENLKTLEEIKKDLTTVKNELKTLKELHNE